MNKNYDAHTDILCKNGFYPYALVEAINKFDDLGLPPKSVF